MRVFSNKIATVIGPTPLGTGVIPDTLSKTSLYATSPTNFCYSPFSSYQVILFTAASIIVAPSLIISLVIKLGWPAAEIIISASNVCSFRDFVSFVQTVIVAGSFYISNWTNGLPTSFPAPTITISLFLMSTLYSSNILRIACGVTGTNEVSVIGWSNS